MQKDKTPPASVRAQFKDWCKPRRGNSNPEIQTNDVWSWLIKTRTYPCKAHEFSAESKRPAPIWCFDRMGQSGTLLPDGTIVYIGGEHEDHYDPDFYIYNDVVVVRPDGGVEIYGYPKDVFPPTDFHTATLIDDQIIIIGGLRYPKDRVVGQTFVFKLDLADFSIDRIVTDGTPPTWLHDHDAVLDEPRLNIICTGGEITHLATKRSVENLSTWELNVETFTWTETETKPFERWLFVREDESLNELWQIGSIVSAIDSPHSNTFVQRFRDEFAARKHIVDANTYHNRFKPPVQHISVEKDPQKDEFKTHRIVIDDVTVRYVEDMYEIAVTVEGKLDAGKLEKLKRHGVETYAKLEGVPYKCIII